MYVDDSCGIIIDPWLVFATFLRTFVINSATCMAVCVCSVIGPLLTTERPLANAIKMTN